MTLITTLPDRLKTARESLRMNQKDMAKAIGIAYSSWIGYEDGANVPGGKVLEALARQGIDLNWLMCGEGEMKRPKVQAALKGGDNIFGEHPEDYVKVPKYDVDASAGGGSSVVTEQIVDYIQFKPDWIKNVLGVPAQNLALIRVKGDSMETTLSDGDMLLIDTTDRHFEANAIYVLQLEGSLLVKRIQRKVDGTIMIKSDNKAYDPETVRGDMVDQLHVVGRVVWYGRRG